MPTILTTLERAFVLARSGECACIGDLVKRLDREGYDGRQIYGPLLRKQIQDLVKEAKKRHSGSPS
ncbi:hypothetical protein [Methylocystis hirsuta]|uniref:Uncharacterized protein n=1 Tax=Methylocystis hirsuta TaxID=369798 RepID=A0A3M9XQJ5_9HYPH|nr:hypothetical protein [Methylocystis hirsuta]RNJ50042.1 hypothetical protein D1O30_10960 [Methylocystis hirsuta]